MIKDFLNRTLENLPSAGLDIHIIKKYEVRTDAKESFEVANFSIMLIKSGKLTIEVRAILLNIEPRDLLVIPIDSLCRIVQTDDKLQFFLISFTPEFIIKYGLKRDLIDSFYYLLGKSIVKIGLDDKEFSVLSLIYKLIYFVNKDFKAKEFDHELQRVSFNLLLYELRLIYSHQTSDNFQIFPRKESLVVQFLTILSIHYKRQHGVQFYAGALFVTPNHLNKVVNQVTGKSVKKLIVNAIISEAENLLEDPQLNIVDIAEELGFGSSNSFSIFFKKHSSISPSRYRNRFKEI
ncbi:helix-turn-helix domain-containing protein [Flavobacterium sp. TAB 87]|uniref:AraC family transcriptional regulator n=1 Tax=Flavobacterium sp. TAB 87 TaxID=1729581 RepID=UPI00076CD275|nr:helix-turn-helix domain-containing protein [Flavobacterium sp. TAB 87]KVV16214.1 L-rhamnose operon transcriptional activator RhaR [Flavobacterium sp. TAB 87]